MTAYQVIDLATALVIGIYAVLSLAGFASKVKQCWESVAVESGFQTEMEPTFCELATPFACTIDPQPTYCELATPFACTIDPQPKDCELATPLACPVELPKEVDEQKPKKSAWKPAKVGTHIKAEIAKMKKTELVGYLESLKLPSNGTVKELRTRINDFYGLA